MDPITITGPDDFEVDWTKEPEFQFPDELTALRTLSRLGDELDAAREQVRQTMRYLMAAVTATRAVTEDGEPVSKQAIIGASGLARQTVYDILDSSSHE